MIPVLEPGYSYEAKGPTANGLIFTRGDGAYSAFMFIDGRHFNIEGVSEDRLAEWLPTIPIPDNVTWTSKKLRRPTWERGEDGFVYFISDEDGFIKIGRALRPRQRLSDFQIANRQKLVLLATIPGGQAKESEMHRRFAASRHRGEWFTPTSDLVAFITEVSA